MLWGVPAVPALPAAPGTSLGAGKVDPMDSVLSGGISSEKQSCVCPEQLQGSRVGCAGHPEMVMFTMEITWFEHLRGGSTTSTKSPTPSPVLFVGFI